MEKTANKFKRENFKTIYHDKDMKVPVIFHTGAEIRLSEESLFNLKKTSSRPEIFRHIAVLSDYHEKKNALLPAGVITASRKHILPQLVDAAPNCGLRLIATDLKEDEVSKDKIKDVIKSLSKVIPTSTYLGKKIPWTVTLDIFRQGIDPLRHHLKSRIKNEIEKTYKNGNFFQDGGDEEISVRCLKDVVPSFFLRLAQRRLGVLGATKSHFIVMLQVKDIFNQEKSQELGLTPNQYLFLIHTGSGIVGRLISNLYTPTKKNTRLRKLLQRYGEISFDTQMKPVFRFLRKKVKDAEKNRSLLAFEEDGLEARMFINAHRAAGNFGFANRTAITHELDFVLEKIFGRPVQLEVICDMPHVEIAPEKHFGKSVWVHRNGASRALPGEPVIIAPDNNELAFIGLGAEGNQSTFFSANHELAKREAEKISKENRDDKKTDQKNQTGKDDRVEESSDDINQDINKDILETIAELEKNEIIKCIASFKVLAKYTHK